MATNTWTCIFCCLSPRIELFLNSVNQIRLITSYPLTEETISAAFPSRSKAVEHATALLTAKKIPASVEILTAIAALRQVGGTYPAVSAVPPKRKIEWISPEQQELDDILNGEPSLADMLA